MSDFRRILLAGLKPLDPNTVPETHKIYYTASEQLPNPKFIRVGYHSYDSNSGEGMIVSYKPITSIGGYAFRDCLSLTDITIPNSVTSIGYSAFSHCTSLTNITIPNNVTSIGDSAFNGCSGLTSIIIPNSVTEIGDLVFQDCGGELITQSNIPGSTSAKSSKLYGSKFTKITFGDDVTSIGSYILCGNAFLTSVVIGNGVTSIGEYAFAYCPSLTNVSISDSVTSIGAAAFMECKNLTSVTIPDSVTSIGWAAFYECSSLTSVTIPGSVTKIETAAFNVCESLTSVYCKATTPPTGGDYMFGATASDRIIYVPTESVDTYKAATNWSYYADYIVGYDFN